MMHKASLARIDQKLSDFIDMYKEHRTEDQVKFKTVETLKIKVDRMERPLKWAGGLMTVAAMGSVTVLGEKLVKWMLHR